MLLGLPAEARRTRIAQLVSEARTCIAVVEQVQIESSQFERADTANTAANIAVHLQQRAVVTWAHP